MDQITLDDEKLYTAKEAAQILEVTIETVKKYCRTKKIMGKQIGPKKQWKIMGSEIAQLQREWGIR